MIAADWQHPGVYDHLQQNVYPSFGFKQCNDRKGRICEYIQLTYRYEEIGNHIVLGSCGDVEHHGSETGSWVVYI